MKNQQLHWAAAALAAFTFVAAQPVQADEPRTFGPGMMGNYGAGTGPSGYGPGMMGSYGYHGSPGMMGGSYGPGMMGGGMMGWGPLYALNLNEQQLTKINQIRDESRRKNWDVMGKVLDERSRLRDMLASDKRDPAAIGKQFTKVAELRRQLLEASVDTHNRIEALLTKEQRDQLRSFRRGWMMGDGD